MKKIESCLKDNATYKKVGRKYVFHELKQDSDIDDPLDKIKNKFKRYKNFYEFLINIIAPVFIDKSLKNFIDRYVHDQTITINLGSGNTKISQDIINIDIFSYDNVDIVCDIKDLPFKDNSIDIIMNNAVLEHVPYPQKVVDEIYRVLKPNGLIYTQFPFMQGFHASPFDFTRVTEEGIKILHKDFKPIEIKPYGGPTSGMLWLLQEWIAILLSFGSKKAHLIIYILVMCVTFPIKFLDILLIKHPMAKNITSGIVFIGRK